MTGQEAADTQYRRSSRYTVHLVSPAGERIELGHTPRKTGSGLVAILVDAATQAKIRDLFGSEAGEISFKKFASALLFSNGWKMMFGGTIRQESV